MIQTRDLETRLRQIQQQIEVWKQIKPSDKKPPNVIRNGLRYLYGEEDRLIRKIGGKVAQTARKLRAERQEADRTAKREAERTRRAAARAAKREAAGKDGAEGKSAAAEKTKSPPQKKRPPSKPTARAKLKRKPPRKKSRR